MKWIIAFVAMLTVTCAVWAFVDHRHRQQLQILATPLPAVVPPDGDDAFVEEKWDFAAGVPDPEWAFTLAPPTELSPESAVINNTDAGIALEQEETPNRPFDGIDCVLKPTD